MGGTVVVLSLALVLVSGAAVHFELKHREAKRERDWVLEEMERVTRWMEIND